MVLSASIVVMAGLALLFYFYPSLDLSASRLLYRADHHFIGSDSAAFAAFRFLFTAMFSSVCILTVIGCLITQTTRGRWLKLASRDWLYMAACLLIGPLTIVNLGFKDHWGRPRPGHVTAFGGGEKFVPALKPSNQCNRNCSFVSGEASSIYIICFAAAFLFPDAATVWLLSGIALGGLAGFIRIAQGGHFFSDVLFAGVFMAITAAVLQLFFLELTTCHEDS